MAIVTFSKLITCKLHDSEIVLVEFTLENKTVPEKLPYCQHILRKQTLFQQVPEAMLQYYTIFLLQSVFRTCQR